MVQHKHLIIRSEVLEPILDPLVAEDWMKRLIQAIGMKLFRGPISGCTVTEGNHGVTCVAIIETSHIALHIWDDIHPGLVQLDVYSCADFEISSVLLFLGEMNPVKTEYKFLNRETGLKEIE